MYISSHRVFWPVHVDAFMVRGPGGSLTPGALPQHPAPRPGTSSPLLAHQPTLRLMPGRRGSMDRERNRQHVPYVDTIPQSIVGLAPEHGTKQVPSPGLGPMAQTPPPPLQSVASGQT